MSCSGAVVPAGTSQGEWRCRSGPGLARFKAVPMLDLDQLFAQLGVEQLPTKGAPWLFLR